ncbi:hsp70 nucleotide exchange factor fes1 [Rhizina undulata]
MSNLGKLLAWGIENSDAGADGDDGGRRSQLDPALLAQLFGANVKDDSVLMKEAMEAIQDESVPLADKETAFDNFEMLVENLDNANNIENLSLWPALLSQLSAPEEQLRHMAAWCCGTAVQNNPKSQAALYNHGGVPKMVDLIMKDPEESVRNKAIYALSSQIRNSEPSLKQAVELLPDEIVQGRDIQADNMEAIDGLINRLRERAKKVING